MPESGFALGDQPGLDEVARTDLLLDALAGRERFSLDDPDDDALAALMGEWRDDLRWPPASALVSQNEAVDALILGLSERRRSRRAWAAIGSVAATLLALSGLGAVVADARPGDLLYGLHSMLFNEPRVSEDQIMLSAKADLAKAEQMIAQGQWDQAESQLAEVSSTLQTVNDGSRRQHLLNELNQLNTKVEKRDPNATLPAGGPPQSGPTGVLAPQVPPGNSLTPLAPETVSPVPPNESGAPESAPAPSASPTTTGAKPSASVPPAGATATSPAPTSVPTPPVSAVVPGETPADTSVVAPGSPAAAGAAAPGPAKSAAPGDATNPGSPVVQTSGQPEPAEPAPAGPVS
ncbi:anti-sigma-D factor RsdA [Mycobacterium marinum]|uniref:anti-sigma-D factor RsdA n=1 Tax=Mycobacterium marinum TaxID=1781 RepID=UPI002340FC65|nr:anti-sigma-D factor RsdA [Mycobacterium marinum]MDC8981289.1 anti-sigma-D factor RsdA [Mycobacterium marinum]MDC8994271.1 anti-sigma-D factor RsdA [Mycobacterium marinum]MDC8999878.1 anti-sigma-D factor RsdA [Mycobacterium marinum]MDC9010601.1 anti-sigma-D factor RsdA [Mycobacterium marinum]MDC9013958.1 anti-sigma-D factor RsdA [Mycobacterium marinum]